MGCYIVKVKYCKGGGPGSPKAQRSRHSGGGGTAQRTVCTARTKDGVADGAAGAEDSAADGLHSEDKGRCGERPAQEDKGRRSGRCCGS